MILTLKVTLLSGANANGKWEGVIEIHSSSTLEELHLEIQNALNFDNDHYYEFYTARTERSRDRISFDEENGEIYERTVESIYPLPERHSFYYLFDYGDHWLFRIARTKTATQEPDPSINYPRLLSEAGERPEQYPSMED